MQLKKNKFTFFLTDNYAEVYTVYPIIHDLSNRDYHITVFLDENLFFNKEILTKFILIFKELKCELIFSKKINQKQLRIIRIIKEFTNFFLIIHKNRKSLFQNKTIFIENSFRTKVSLFVVIYSFFFKNKIFIYDHGSKLVFYVNRYKKRYLFFGKERIYHLSYSKIEEYWIRNNDFKNLVKVGFPIVPNKINKLLTNNDKDESFFLICGRGVGAFINVEEYDFIINSALSSLRKYFKNEKIIYYPHPKERSFELCKSIIDKYENVEIADLNYPSIDYVSRSIGVITILSSIIFLARAFEKKVIEYYPYKHNLKKFHPELNYKTPYSKLGFPSARNVSDLENLIRSEFLNHSNKDQIKSIEFNNFDIEEILKKIS